MLRTLSGQPSLRSMAHRPSRPTVSKALVRYTKRMYRLWFCLRNFSLICRTANIMSTVPLFLLKAQWLSEMTSSKKWCVIQFSMIRAKIFPGILNSEMPLWLSQDVLSSLFLYRWMMLASLKSWDTKPFSRNCCINSVTLTEMTSPLSLKIFTGIHQEPVLPQPGVAGGSSRELSLRRWSICWMAYWSIWDGLLRSWLKILCQRWTISDFPVNRAPSEDGTGTMALEEGPYTVFKPSKNLLKLCLSEYCSSSAALCCHHLFFIWVQEQVFNQVDVIDNHEVSLCLA